MLKFRDYVRVESRAAYEKALESIEGPVILVAGGSDVVVQAREDDRFKDHTAVDIFGVSELRGIREEGSQLVIGAAVTHEEIVRSPLVRKYAPILAEACHTVGSPQIRNHATIGGNIANASPAADTLAALAVLGAKLVLWRAGQEETVPLVAVFEGPYRTNLGDRDLILSVVIDKVDEDVCFNFTKVGRRKALSISRMTIATLLARDASGVVTRFDMTVGATFPTPVAFPDISAMLVGKKPDAEDIRKVARALSDKIPEIAGIRASTRYKQPVCRRLSERILTELIGD